MAGVAYDAAGGQGGQAVGLNPAATMVAPGATRQYRYYLDPLMGEGAKVFHSGGDSFQLTAHGLFGTLIAEPAGARWYDPMSGAEKTGDATWSNWEAMIRPPTGPTFREFTSSTTKSATRTTTCAARCVRTPKVRRSVTRFSSAGHCP